MLKGKEFYVISISTSMSGGYFSLKTYIQKYVPPLDKDGNPKKDPKIKDEKANNEEEEAIVDEIIEK